MKPNDPQVTTWRIVDAAGNELLQGTYQAIAKAWAEHNCQPGSDHLEYLVEYPESKKRVARWQPTALLPASAFDVTNGHREQ